MAISNAVRVFRKILYRAKHLYGFTVVLRKRDTTPTFDVETGEETSDDTDYTIKKVVELARHEFKDFEYDLSYIAAGKNFVYGAYFDVGHKLCIFDRRQLRNAADDGYYDIELGDQILISNGTDHDVYEIKDINRLKGNLGYIVGLTHVNSDSDTVA